MSIHTKHNLSYYTLFPLVLQYRSLEKRPVHVKKIQALKEPGFYSVKLSTLYFSGFQARSTYIHLLCTTVLRLYTN